MKIERGRSMQIVIGHDLKRGWTKNSKLLKSYSSIYTNSCLFYFFFKTVPNFSGPELTHPEASTLPPGSQCFTIQCPVLHHLGTVLHHIFISLAYFTKFQIKSLQHISRRQCIDIYSYLALALQQSAITPHIAVYRGSALPKYPEKGKKWNGNNKI
jgi:hypothetical protein